MRRFALYFIAFPLCLILSEQAYGGTKSVFKIGSELVIEKDERVRHAVSFGGQITVSGRAEGNVVAFGSSVVLKGSAEVAGDVISLGGVIVRGRGTEVKGHLMELNLDEISRALALVLSEEWEGWSWVFALVSIFFFLCLLVLAFIINALLPRQMGVISEDIKTNPLRAGFWGVVGLISIVPLAALLTMSVVGIVLVPVEIALGVLVALMGFIAAARLIGREVLLRLKKERGIMTQTSLGLVVIWVIGWIPYLGWLTKTLAIVVGMGSVLVTRFGTVKR